MVPLDPAPRKLAETFYEERPVQAPLTSAKGWGGGWQQWISWSARGCWRPGCFLQTEILFPNEALLFRPDRSPKNSNSASPNPFLESPSNVIEEERAGTHGC